jgi:hypothetical protein
MPVPYDPQFEAEVQEKNYVHQLDIAHETIRLNRESLARQTQADAVLAQVYNCIKDGWPTTNGEQLPEF